MEKAIYGGASGLDVGADRAGEHQPRQEPTRNRLPLGEREESFRGRLSGPEVVSAISISGRKTGPGSFASHKIVSAACYRMGAGIFLHHAKRQPFRTQAARSSQTGSFSGSISGASLCTSRRCLLVVR